MTPQLLIVLLVIAALVVFVVTITRYLQREHEKSLAYVREFAERLGASLEREYPARLTGTLEGRRYIVSAMRSGTRTQVTRTQIEVPVVSPVQVQIQHQASDLGARMAGDQELGDADFDAACFLRTSDIELVRRALDEGMRRDIADSCRSSDLTFLVVHNGWLRIDLRGLPDDPDNETRITTFLRHAVALANRLDAHAAP